MESRLNRPRLKQELRPVGANVRTRGIRRRDPEVSIGVQIWL
jgi:hypothetical protein